MIHHLFRTVASVLLIIALSACATLDYRQVQGDFANAVAADNEWSASPFGANTSEYLYGTVRADLTNEFIRNLDPQLQANAWLLRAVSEWRLGQLTEAHDSAAAGLRAILPAQQGSRDHIMLSMLDGLIIDSELHAKFQPGESLDLATYEREFSSGFAAGLAELDKAYDLAGEATPQGVKWYYRYHRWRLIHNWSSVITQIEPRADRVAARSGAESVVGGDLFEAARKEYDEIPEDHPLAALVRSQDPEVGGS